MANSRTSRAAPPSLLAGIAGAVLALVVGCSQPDEGDSTSPFVRFEFPAEFALLSDIVNVRVEARDNVGIRRVLFMARGDTLASVSGEPPYAFAWNTTAYPDCTDANSFVLLTAVAEDFADNRRSISRKYFLDNEGLPPLAVMLFPPTSVTKHLVTLEWEPSLDYDFSHYMLHRDTTLNVTAASDSPGRLDDPGATTFTDEGVGVSPFGLLEDTDYHYRLYVHDVFGRATASDSVVTAHTLLPQAVPLRATALVTKYLAGLSWDLSSEDVAYYRLHRGSSPQSASLDSIAGFSPASFSHIDSGLTAATTYFYYLYVVDEAGYTNPFLEADALELRTDSLPAPVLTDPPPAITKYTATLEWGTITEQEDSSWVALYRGSGVEVDSTDALIHAAPRNQVLTLTDEPLTQGQSYSYRMRHRDTQNNIAWSNILTLTTLTLDDVWQGGLGVSQQGKYGLDLIWDTYNYTSADDFAGYTLSRDGQVIFTSGNRTDSNHADGALSKNTLYQYVLEVADTSGAIADADLGVSTRDIFPADIISVDPDSSWSYRLAWLPSQEPDSEFDHYLLLRAANTSEPFTDTDGNNSADCLQSGDCVQVETFTERLPAGVDTFTYVDNDATLADTTQLVLPIYAYVVLTYDRMGEYVRSNIKGDTLYSPPSSVTVMGPGEHGEVSETSIKIQWTRATWPSPALDDWLFSRYEAWRYAVSGETPWEAGETDKLVHTADLIDATTYSDASAEAQHGARWYYVVIVRDIFGQGAESNEVEGFSEP